MAAARWPTFLIAGSLVLLATVASADPEQAPKPKAKAPQQRLAEIDRELEQNREKIAMAMKVLETPLCAYGAHDVIAQARDDRQKLEELRKKGVPAGELAALTERLRQSDEMLEKLRAALERSWRAELERSAVLDVASKDMVTLKSRNAELEAERAALVKAAPGAR